MRLERAGGWRWWSSRGVFFVSLATDIYWFHLEVGPVSVAVERRGEYRWRTVKDKQPEES